MAATISTKICLVGDFAVGKTSLVRRYVDQQFSDEYLSTVGVKISRKLLHPGNGESSPALQIMIWDLEGASTFRGVESSYLRGARGAIIVGDLTRKETLENINLHIEHFARVNPDGQVVVALNKCDAATEQDQVVPAFANKARRLQSFRTSAKTGAGVDELFRALGTLLTGG